MPAPAKIKINRWVFVLGLSLITLTPVIVWCGQSLVLSLPENFHVLYSFLGNTVTLLSGLEVLLLSVVALVALAGNFLLYRLTVIQLSWLCPSHKWVTKLPAHQESNLREFVVTLHRQALLADLTDTGLETILTSRQFVSGTRIPAEFVTKTVRETVIEVLDGVFFLQTFDTLIGLLSTHVSAKQLSLIQLSLVIRGGYVPTSQEFNSLWIYTLTLLESYSRFAPTTLTTAHKESMFIIWLAISPVGKLSQFEEVDTSLSTLDLFKSIKQIIVEEHL